MTAGINQPHKEQIKNIVNPDEAKTKKIQALNDLLRITGRSGIVLMTDGIAGLGGPLVAKIFKSISEFNRFTEDNDPWGEHDCAVLEVEGVRVIWKIDYYDRQRRFHSPDPSDPKVTVRVMTVMRADEY